jgi:DNA-binding MarR family transcriptional regulator
VKKDTFRNKRTDAIMAIVRTGDILNRYLQIELAKHGSSLGRFAIMNALFVHGGKMTPTAISKWVFRSKHSVTDMLHVLEDIGVIRRDPNRKDGRSVNISVTKKGLEKTEKMIPIAEQISEQALSFFNEEQLEALLSLLRQLRKHLLKRLSEAPSRQVDAR